MRSPYLNCLFVGVTSIDRSRFFFDQLGGVSLRLLVRIDCVKTTKAKPWTGIPGWAKNLFPGEAQE